MTPFVRAVGVGLWLAAAAIHAQAQGLARVADQLTPQARAAARVHAQDVTDIFREACFASRSEPEAVADWALNNGFVTSSAAGRELAGQLLKRGEQGNVFSRGPGDEGLLLVSTAGPSNCLVMGLQAVDGPRLRGRMEALITEWTQARTVVEPTASKDFDESGLRHRTLTFLAVSGNDRYRLMVISPLGVARGIAIMGMSVEPR